jgi:hypothetical protein
LPGQWNGFFARVTKLSTNSAAVWPSLFALEVLFGFAVKVFVANEPDHC